MVWVHHMFTLGYGPWVNSIFALTSMIIAVPTGVKVFNWLATLWGGHLRFTTAMHWVLGFLISFTIGGISGIMLAMAPADLQFNDSYFVVAHFHYTLVGGALFGIFAGVFYWFPIITGRMLNERLGKVAFWVTFIGFNATFFPMHFLGLIGMPRRIYTYPAGLGFTAWNQVSTVGAFVFGAGVLLVLVNVVASVVAGRRAVSDPWDGRTLEWSLPSPVPAYNFAHLPLVRGRDALFVEKVHGNGTILDAPLPSGHGAPAGTVHMPRPTVVPLVLAAGIMGLGYAMLYQNVWVAAAFGALTVFAIHRSMFQSDPGEYMEVGGDAAPAAAQGQR